jgi:hypothetical protein
MECEKTASPKNRLAAQSVDGQTIIDARRRGETSQSVAAFIICEFFYLQNILKVITPAGF